MPPDISQCSRPLTSHWPELGHRAIFSFMGAWESKNLVFQPLSGGAVRPERKNGEN